MFTIYKHFGNFVKCIFTILLQIQHENNFLPTSKHRQAKDSRFLGICLYDCFIYRSNFVFQKCLETRRHFGSGRKTVNSSVWTRENELDHSLLLRIFRVTGANQDARKLLFTDLVNRLISGISDLGSFNILN